MSRALDLFRGGGARVIDANRAAPGQIVHPL